MIGAVIMLQILYPSGLYYVRGQSANRSMISVSAEGIANGTPTHALMYVTVFGTGNTSRIAVANLSSTLVAFNRTVAPYINNNFSLVTTQSYSVYRQTPWPPIRPLYNASIPVTTVYNSTGNGAYNATELISIELNNIKNVSPLLLALSNIKDIYVSSVSSQLSANETQTLRNEAYAAAMANATAQAQAVAPSGSTLTPMNISIGSYYFYPVAQATGAESSVPPIYYSGQQQVSVSVTVQFSYSK